MSAIEAIPTTLIPRHLTVKSISFSSGVFIETTFLVWMVLGPVHHDDLLYLLTARGAVTDFDFDTADSEHVTKATGLWAAFVQNG